MSYNISFIGSISLRTYFYLKAIKEYGIPLKDVYIYNYKKLDIESYKDETFIYKSFRLCLDLEMDELLKSFNAKILPYQSINEMQDNVERMKTDIIIFSGKSAEIVAPHILEKKKFLHIHPGKLPQYRGSTTIYYSLLKEAKCYATAFFLDEKIDTGKVIKQMEFSVLNIDLDYMYDPLIRTYLLLNVLKNEEFNDKAQDNKDAKEYYIIHPVLKKLAHMKKDKLL